MATSCALVIPGLFPALLPGDDPNALPQIDLPALQTILSAANRVTPIDDHYDALALQLLGYAMHADEELPMAAIRQRAAGQPIRVHCWCADPVFQLIDRDRAVLLGSEPLRLSAQDSEALIDTLNHHFDADGIHFSAVRPMQWLVQFPQPMRLRSTPLRAALSRDTQHTAVNGDDARQWRIWLNEIEMVLHHHPLNHERESRGAWPVNSVWLWGGGEWRDPIMPVFDRIYVDDPVTDDMAHVMNTAAEVLPLDMTAVDLSKPINTALFLTDLPALVRQGEIGAWQTQLESWDKQLIAPLLQQFKTGAIEELRVYSDRHAFDLQRIRWWKRTRPFVQLWRHYAQASHAR